MIINTVEKFYDLDNNFSAYKVTDENNKIYTVPLDEANRHYQEILEWVANGGTIVDNGE